MKKNSFFGSLPIAVVIVLSASFLNAQETGNCKCCTPEQRQFDFWIGEWEVYTAKGLAGTNTIVALEERYQGKGETLQRVQTHFARRQQKYFKMQNT
jgi:hypothetical protein